MTVYKQAVALVPGFLGFNHRRGTTYFADRFVAGLRTRLEEKCGGPIPVVPVSTLPIGSLAERQEKLLADLDELDVRLGYPMWHLVGHSTGGVDAAMLARTHRLESTRQGSRFSKQTFELPRLLSVTTLSAPHYGTCLALSPLARFVRHMPSFAGLGQGLNAVGAAFQRDRRWQRLAFILPSLLHNSEFYLNFLSNPLATDLTPNVSGALTMTHNRRPGVCITSVASVAPKPNEHVTDSLFALLWRLTQKPANDAGLIPPPPFPQLTAADVVSASPDLPLIDHDANDSIVSTDRQIDAGGHFGGVIVGDHGDVIGRYQRLDVLDQKVIDPGLLTSGANFDDDQFFAVLDRIARAIPCVPGRHVAQQLHAAE